jgi:CheY-like chemotaxis protein
MQKQLLGTETTHALRSKGVQAKICGLSANEMAEEFFAAGANNFVCKPLPTKKDSLHQILCEIMLDECTKRKSTGILKVNSSAGKYISP